MSKLWIFQSRSPGGKWRHARFNGFVQGATTERLVWSRLEWLLDNRPGFEHRAAPHVIVGKRRKAKP